jgi:transcription initiation factor IIE alpha subunit
MVTNTIEDAKAHSPDEVAEALHKRVGILKSELTDLRQDNAAHAEQIRVKEEQLNQVRGQIRELSEQIERAKVVLEEYEYFKNAFTCPVCGAELISLDDEYHAYFKLFECGYAIGDLHNHPCPYDPKFPKLDDYELEMKQFKGRPDWWCSAKPKTEMAGKLELDTTRGDTPEEAKARMRERYELAARNVPKQE